MRQFRVALFSPDTEYYGHLLKSLAEGFKKLGHKCVWQSVQQPHDAIAAWAQASRIDFVLEINRVLPRDQKWPEGVAHACWLQDRRIGDRLLTHDLGKSDHIYLLFDPSAFSLDLTGRRWSILSPAARPDVPAPQAAPGRCDFAFCGYMGRPVHPDLALAVAADNSPVPYKTFIAALPPEALSHINFTPVAMERVIKDVCDRHGWRFDERAFGLFEEVLMRTYDRAYIVDTLLGISQNLEIWGPIAWANWPQYISYYKGQLPAEALDAHVYQQARVNIHTGALAVHFRLFDCLAAGGFMLVNKTPFDDMPGGISALFIDGVHYASYTLNTLKDVAARYLHNPEARQTIAAEGRRKVLADHTWAHRAEQIIADFADCGRS